MKRILLLIILLALPFIGFAEVKIIEVKHRAAETLEEQVRSILDDGEKVQAAGTHLILIASGESLQAAERMIALLDVVQQNLLIRVRQSEQRQQAGGETSASVHYNSKTGLSTAGQGGVRLSNSSTVNEQSLIVAEGGQGLIEVGREIPYTQEWAVLTGETSGYSESTAYKTVATGFWIFPEKVVGEQVLVDVEPYISRSEQGRTQPPEVGFSQLRTRLQVPLGQWYPLGSQLQHRNKLSKAIISWHSSDGQSDHSLEIRIDPAE